MIDRDKFNALQASRKADREAIARELIAIGEKHGATIKRRDDPPNPGYCGASIVLEFGLAGVGAMVDIDNLFGGSRSLISWYNSQHPARNFADRFNFCVGEPKSARPHHKATSCPADWYSLAMFLDGGLCLAARGEAFAPAT